MSLIRYVSKVMVCGKSQRGEQLNLSLKREVLEEVDAFKYLGTIVGKNRVLREMC